MSIFTVAECDQMIQALKCALIEDPGGSIGSITVDGHTVTYASAKDLEERIKMYQRWRNDALRSAAGCGRTRISVAKFS